jgi:glutaconate CoA-transferase subunit B
MRHDRRRFVEKCDFITTPGYLSGPGARERAGLPPGTGPLAVITGMARMGFDPATCRMRLEALAPGVTQRQVIENTGFELLIATDIEQIEAPSAEELRLLRDVIDPMRLYI